MSMGPPETMCFGGFSTAMSFLALPWRVGDSALREVGSRRVAGHRDGCGTGLVEVYEEYNEREKEESWRKVWVKFRS